jgi:LysM repeat protein
LRSGTPRSKTSKNRKQGRHRRPSHAQKVARQAGRVAPVLAVAGAIAASPQALAAPLASQSQAAPAAGAGHAIAAYLDAARRPAAALAERTYTVAPGDTLSAIAQRLYGRVGDWPWLYRVNRATISDPNLITAGQVLTVPADPPASVVNGTSRPRHAKASSATTSGTSASASTAADPPRAGSTASSGGPGTVTCSAGAQGMVPQNYATIVSFLTSHGYTGLAAAGIAGNIFQESEGNPESVGSGGGGLIGFTPLPSGYVTGNPAADLQTQLNAVLTYNQQWSQFIPALNAATSAVQAADIYMNDFERPGIPAAGNREAAAEAVAAACNL